MSTFVSIVKMAGALFPASAALVQLLSDLEMSAIEKRISLIEDPIASSHEKAIPACKAIYERLRSENDAALPWDSAFEDYRDVLRLFAARHFIEGRTTLGKEFAHGIRVIDPSFTLYLFLQSEGYARTMDMWDWFKSKVESGATSIRGEDLQTTLSIPLPVARALFEVSEQSGAGWSSKESGPPVFTPKR